MSHNNHNNKPPSIPVNLTEPLPEKLAQNWHTTPPHPLRRGVARMIDYMFIFNLIWIILLIMAVCFLPNSELTRLTVAMKNIDSPLMIGLVITISSAILISIIIALLQSEFATTPGKWSMGIRVYDADFKKLSLKDSFKRESLALTLGNAFNLMHITVILPIWWYFYLKRTGSTPWDNLAKTKILYRERSVWKLLASAIMLGSIVFGILFLFFVVLTIIQLLNRGLVQ